MPPHPVGEVTLISPLDWRDVGQHVHARYEEVLQDLVSVDPILVSTGPARPLRLGVVCARSAEHCHGRDQRRRADKLPLKVSRQPQERFISSTGPYSPAWAASGLGWCRNIFLTGSAGKYRTGCMRSSSGHPEERINLEGPVTFCGIAEPLARGVPTLPACSPHLLGSLR